MKGIFVLFVCLALEVANAQAPPPTGENPEAGEVVPEGQNQANPNQNQVGGQGAQSFYPGEGQASGQQNSNNNPGQSGGPAAQGGAGCNNPNDPGECPEVVEAPQSNSQSMSNQIPNQLPISENMAQQGTNVNQAQVNSGQATTQAGCRTELGNPGECIEQGEFTPNVNNPPVTGGKPQQTQVISSQNANQLQNNANMVHQGANVIQANTNTNPGQPSAQAGCMMDPNNHGECIEQGEFVPVGQNQAGQNQNLQTGVQGAQSYNQVRPNIGVNTPAGVGQPPIQVHSNQAQGNMNARQTLGYINPCNDPTNPGECEPSEVQPQANKPGLGGLNVGQKTGTQQLPFNAPTNTGNVPGIVQNAPGQTTSALQNFNQIPATSQQQAATGTNYQNTNIAGQHPQYNAFLMALQQARSQGIQNKISHVPNQQQHGNSFSQGVIPNNQQQHGNSVSQGVMSNNQQTSTQNSAQHNALGKPQSTQNKQTHLSSQNYWNSKPQGATAINNQQTNTKIKTVNAKTSTSLPGTNSDATLSSMAKMMLQFYTKFVQGKSNQNSQTRQSPTPANMNQISTNQVNTNQFGSNKASTVQIGTNQAGTNQAGNHQFGIKQTGTNQLGPNQAGFYQLGSNQASTHQFRPNQAGIHKAVTNQASVNQFGANQAGTHQFVTNQANVNQFGANQAGTHQFVTNQANVNQFGANQAGNHQFVTNQANVNQFGTNQAGTHQSVTNQANVNQFGTNRANSNQYSTNQAVTNQLGTNQAVTNQFGTNQAVTNQFGKNKAFTNQFGTNQAVTNQFGKNKAFTNQFGTNQAVTNQFGTNQAVTNQFGTNQASTSPIGTKQPSTNQFGTNQASVFQFGTNKANIHQYVTNQAGTNKFSTNQPSATQVNNHQRYNFQTNSGPRGNIKHGVALQTNPTTNTQTSTTNNQPMTEYMMKVFQGIMSSNSKYSGPRANVAMTNNRGPSQSNTNIPMTSINRSSQRNNVRAPAYNGPTFSLHSGINTNRHKPTTIWKRSITNFRRSPSNILSVPSRMNNHGQFMYDSQKGVIAVPATHTSPQAVSSSLFYENVPASQTRGRPVFNNNKRTPIRGPNGGPIPNNNWIPTSGPTTNTNLMTYDSEPQVNNIFHPTGSNSQTGPMAYNFVPNTQNIQSDVFNSNNVPTTQMHRQVPNRNVNTARSNPQQHGIRQQPNKSITGTKKSSLPVRMHLMYSARDSRGRTWTEAMVKDQHIQTVVNMATNTFIVVDSNPSLDEGLFSITGQGNTCYIGSNAQNKDLIYAIKFVAQKVDPMKPFPANPWVTDAVIKEKVTPSFLQKFSKPLAKQCGTREIVFITPVHNQGHRFPVPGRECYQVTAATICITPEMHVRPTHMRHPHIRVPRKR